MTPTTPTIVLATTNAGKIAEFHALLESVLDLTQIRLVSPVDLGIVVPPVEESGHTFVDNACLKALAYAEATGYASLADDSGLCVDALDGAPGLYSARWAGAAASDSDRTALLLREMRDVRSVARTARFVCAAAIALPGVIVGTAEGVCRGLIASEPQGKGGFGYDPVFTLPECGGLTMAQLPPAQKNRISHRALALDGLLSIFSALGVPQR